MEGSTLLVQAFMGSFIYAQPLSLSRFLSLALALSTPIPPPPASQTGFMVGLRAVSTQTEDEKALTLPVPQTQAFMTLHRISTEKPEKTSTEQTRQTQERGFQADSACAVIATARPQARGLENQPGSDALLSAVTIVRRLGRSRSEPSLHNHPLSDLKESNYISSVLFIHQRKMSVHNLDTSVCVNISLKLMRLRGCGNAGGGSHRCLRCHFHLQIKPQDKRGALQLMLGD